MKSIKYLILLLLFSCQVTNLPETAKPIVIITFDDQHISIYDVALPILQQYNFPATSFINTLSIGAADKLSWPQVEELEFDYNWETAGHTLHHVQLTALTLEETDYEVGQDWQNLKDHCLSHDSFALPSGHATEAQYDIISQYYRNIRSSRDLRESIPLDREHLGYFAYQTDFTAQDAINRIQLACERHEVIVTIGFHRILNTPAGHPRNCTPDDFSEIIEFIHNNDFQVLTLKAACDYFAR